LTTALKAALQSFSERHPKKAFPDHFIIYRDGVGDAMRRQILIKEITQFKQAIDEAYNKAAKKPKMTVIIVNKRITQRFFIEGEDGTLNNPPSGCIIDSKLVESDDAEGTNSEYDFFLIPQFANQGCVLPTHFYVAFNDSNLAKSVIEKFTFDLCHYYYNWAGPIKVPAPCMYAHKIAELFTNVEPGKKSVMNTQDFSAKIFESLHFL
jgi:aubergine-like protein